jgi:cysteinyl-tRNA synthetase
VRLYLVSHRYSRDWTFDWKGLARSVPLVDALRKLLADDARTRKKPAAPAPALIKEFNSALADDLDTPRAVRALRAALRQRDAAAARAMLDILVGSASLS